MVERPICHRTIALLLVCLLASMTMLGLESSPPEVTIGQIPGLDDGIKIFVKGILVDLWSYETGSESLVLAVPSGAETVRVISSPGGRPQPSKYADIGDEVLVLGELSKNGGANTVFSSSDCISVARESEEVVTIEMLRDSWHLLEGDNVHVRCLLDYDDQGMSLRLYSADRKISLLARINGFDPSKCIGLAVLATGVLNLDPRTLSLELVVSSIVLDA